MLLPFFSCPAPRFPPHRLQIPDKTGAPGLPVRHFFAIPFMEFTMKRLVAIILFMLLSVSPAAADKIVSVTILPFDGSEAGEYAKLSDTLTSILTTRIVSGGTIKLVEHPFNSSQLNQLRGLDGAELHAKLPKMNADFLLKAALYAVQSGLQLHLSVIPLDGKSEPSNFSAFAGAENQIIPAVEDLAQSASACLRGEPAATETLAGLTEETATTVGKTSFDSEHPDRLYRRLAAQGGGSAALTESGVLQAMQRGQSMRLAANAMAVGDLDGDGKRELVLATNGSLRLFSLDDTMNGKALATHIFPHDVRVNMISLADLDGQAGLEIYVSASQGTRPYGAIFTYHSGKLVVKMKGIPWYIRPVAKPGESLELLGQAGNDRPETGYLSQGVHRLRLSPDFSALTDAGQVALPPDVGVFDFAWLDVDGDGKLEVAAIDSHCKLKIFDPQGALLWVSKDEYGGSKNFIGPSLAEDKNGDGATRLLRYIPGRILVIDGDDGKNEIIVSANKSEVTNTWLRNNREYNGGSLNHLVWDGSGMRESWKTKRLSGSISDYGIPQPQGNKANDLQLVAAQRPGRAFLGFTLDDSTVLVGYRIALRQEDKTAPTKDGGSGIKN